MKEVPQENPYKGVRIIEIGLYGKIIGKVRSVASVTTVSPMIEIFLKRPYVIGRVLEQRKIQMILVTEGNPEELKTIEKVSRAADRLNQEYESKQEINGDQLDQVKLDLFGKKPEFANLALFILDPRKRDKFHFRKIMVEQRQRKMIKADLVIVTKYDMEEFEANPVPKEHVLGAMEMVCEQEKAMEGTETQELRATVVTASYAGGKVSVDHLMILAALKYNGMRQAYLKGLKYVMG